MEVNIMDYIKPELLIVAVVLYVVGMFCKKSPLIKDKFIPLILGGLGILLCGIWVIGNTDMHTGMQIAMGIFSTITQGILMAGLSTYVHQCGKQMGKSE